MSVRDFLAALGLPNGVLAVLRAALDASACHPEWIYSVAGYVAPPEAWDKILPIWQDALDYWRIPRFHLCELPDWIGHERAELCEKYFSQIVSQSDLHSIGSAVFVRDWERPDWGDDRSPRFPTAYEQSLWFALNVLGEHCQLEFPERPVAVVCDIDSRGGHALSVQTGAGRATLPQFTRCQ